MAKKRKKQKKSKGGGLGCGGGLVVLFGMSIALSFLVNDSATDEEVVYESTSEEPSNEEPKELAAARPINRESGVIQNIQDKPTYNEVVGLIRRRPDKRRRNPHLPGHYDYMWKNEPCQPIIVTFDGRGSTSRYTGASAGFCFYKMDDRTKLDEKANELLRKNQYGLKGWRACTKRRCP